MTRSLRLVAPLRPPNLRSWSCQAKALASSSRLLRKAVGGWSNVAVQIAKSSARPTVFSSESLGIAGCLMCLPPPGTTQARFSPKVQFQNSPLTDSQKGARSEAGLLDSGGPKRLARCNAAVAARTTLELLPRTSHDDVCGGKQICSNAMINYTFSRMRPAVRIPSAPATSQCELTQPDARRRWR